MAVNYSAWGAIPRALKEGMAAYQQAKEQARQQKMQDEANARQKTLFDVELSEKTRNVPGASISKDLGGITFTPPEAARAAERGAEFRMNRQLAGDQKRQQQNSNLANQFRDEFNQLSKPFLTVAPMYKNVEAGAKTPNPTPASDMNMIFAYMKILDPNSTVREGEYATAAKAGSFGDRVKNAVNQLDKGDKLTDEQRANFLASAQQVYQNQLNLQRQHMTRYRDLAQRAGVRPEDVIFDFAGQDSGPAAPPPATNFNPNAEAERIRRLRGK